MTGKSVGATVSTEERLAEVLAGVVDTEEVPLDSNFFTDLGADSLVMAKFCARVRKRDDLPTVSMKDIYQHSTIESLAAAFPDTAPAPPRTDTPSGAAADVESGVESGASTGAGTQTLLAEVLAGVMRTERVPADGDFFTDLGADSLVMAQFCARVRKRDDLPTVSMKDIYQHSTIESLAAAFPDTATAPPRTDAPPGAAADVESGPQTGRTSGTGAWRYVLCGTAQLLTFVGFSCLGTLALLRGYMWIAAGSGTADVYLRAVAFGAVILLGLCALPVAAKWILIGRFTPRSIPVWSFAYLRFWWIKTLIRTSPARLFVGSPLYVLYLRALGAHIGKGVTVLTRFVPVCPDLITIGDRTVVRKDVLFSGYRAHDGRIETGTLTLGRDVTVSEQAVIDIGTSMGDGSQLGHASSLHSGQTVPPGEAWHGTPARPSSVDYRAVGPVECGTLRRGLYSLWRVMAIVLIYLPLTVAGVDLLLTLLPQLNAVVSAGPPVFTSLAFFLETLVASLVVFFGGLLVGLLTVNTVPRLLSPVNKRGRIYPLYGFHYGVQRAVTRMTNIRFFTTLFGDSSAIVHYLRSLGYDLGRVQQTGSNFGLLVRYDTPYLSRVGKGTMIADGLSVINTDYSSTSFRLSPATIGAKSFLGNNIVYPPRARTGDNCLLATKVMVPVEGPMREGVGLLGSPSFEIPRTVLRDSRLDHFGRGEELRRRLAAKNKHNALTAGLFLLTRWLHFFALALIAMVAVDLYHVFGAVVFALSGLLSLAFSVGYFALVEWASMGFRRLRPLYCSIYEPAFWAHERFWKLGAIHVYMQIFNGTPFKAMLWRLLGMRIGRRVFDDGCATAERTLVGIGDGCTLNAGTVIQCHSQEDGAFKSDHISIGANVTLGVGAFVHYGTTVGDHAQLGADSFLMKGEEVPAQARWSGNPATALVASDRATPERHQGETRESFTDS
ncbi:phosphopantetheine-binding protein [Streptomyces sp. NBC_01619]|uniref:Pls/PosA family non-ribosomal peptide synthetase n=1 Tax=Streptomyces sp. NBC_01619 TaxID=2975901 RepID=UPI0022541915|nr:Pls/PosA family non-ribosomal peptide synthetase [Streptomyces sp. NBC_01619]MCX4514764.1 phosphopantetheine-binding protein [Streptomyces sp. NBC_01619]